MTDTRTAGVIRILADRLEPVTPLWSLTRRAGVWAALSLLATSTVAWLYGVRRDMPAAVIDLTFAIQVLAMGALAGVAGLATLRLVVPGRDWTGAKAGAMVLLAVWPGALLAWHLVGGGAMADVLTEPFHLTCARSIGTSAFVATSGLLALLRRGVVLRPLWVAATAGAAAAGVGAVCVALTCPLTDVPHLLVAHAGPTVVIAGLLSVAVWWWLRSSFARVVTVLVFAAVMAAASSAVAAAEAGPGEAPAFEVAGSTGGYLSKNDLLDFLDASARGLSQATPFDGHGPLLIGVGILVGGVLLNLTPCVLPMIPINLAIIGAGRAAPSRRRGWLLGAAYGSGMALVYGVLGGIVVVTAGTFGQLNGSVWFNLAITALFLVLGLAMFDVVALDLSGWSARVTIGQQSRRRYALAFFMGGVAALLAGACVAPVVIQVVALSSHLYASGAHLALALPLILGIGMGLPWPFAGAGMAALPKPGAWMVRVKQGLGVCIFAMAAYYGHEAWTLAHTGGQGYTPSAHGWYTSLDDGLAAARRDSKPIFLDVWATWCKNCTVMDATTFKDAGVRSALDGYVKVRVQAEDMTEPGTAALLDRLGSVGLPTYAVLHAK